MVDVGVDVVVNLQVLMPLSVDECSKRTRDALNLGPFHCEKGHESFDLMFDEAGWSFSSEMESFCLSQAQTSWPQTGRPL